jgi:hypothetical protein
MAKFIQIRSQGLSDSVTTEHDFYINVEMVKYVEQNPQNPNRSLLRFLNDEYSLPIAESAASFVSRTGSTTHVTSPPWTKQMTALA